MRKLYSTLLSVVFLTTFPPGCNSQDSKVVEKPVDRPAAVAGKFYPSDPKELEALLTSIFAAALPKTTERVIAIICPHAGYEYSGVVAATSINQADADKQYDNIFIIGSSHHASFMGASVYDKGDYKTPLGRVKVNTELGKTLIRENSVFSFQADADKAEHSLEVELPLLQFHQKKPFAILPILLGTQSPQSCKKIAQALKPYFNEHNLFVFSTDFSHYPSYGDAVKVDKKTCDAVVSNSPEKLREVLDENEKGNTANLATSMCGWTSVLTMLYMTEDDPGIRIIPLQYKNSGDSKFADKTQVVGYWSIAVSKNDAPAGSPPPFILSTKDKITLLGIARNTIGQYILNKKTPDIDTAGFSSNLTSESGAFVTLKENGELRGCIGRFTSDEPLCYVIREMAIASSTQDTRFSPVTPGEINKIEIEISVLTPMKKIKSIDEIVLGKHGIYIRKGYMSGTFLPQVATETGWTKEEFLGHCARDKAGIGWNGWKDADIFIYEAFVFSEKDVNVRKNE